MGVEDGLPSSQDLETPSIKMLPTSALIMVCIPILNGCHITKLFIAHFTSKVYHLLLLKERIWQQSCLVTVDSIERSSLLFRPQFVDISYLACIFNDHKLTFCGEAIYSHMYLFLTDAWESA